MRRYFDHIKESRAPHERRQHAMQVAGALAGLLLVVWVGTLGLRLASSDVVATDDGTQSINQDQSLSAAAAASQQQQAAHLEVSTTSVYSY